jgi:hypothetical protein
METSGIFDESSILVSFLRLMSGKRGERTRGTDLVQRLGPFLGLLSRMEWGTVGLYISATLTIWSLATGANRFNEKDMKEWGREREGRTGQIEIILYEIFMNIAEVIVAR